MTQEFVFLHWNSDPAACSKASEINTVHITDLKHIVPPPKKKCPSENCGLGHIAPPLPPAGNPRSDTDYSVFLLNIEHICF